MATIGYARVSSTDQDLAIQEEALRTAGCTIIRSEKCSGTKMEGRDQLQTILDFIHTGDVLTVTKLDRLARSVGDLMRIVDLLAEKGASLRVLNAHIDTSNASGKAFLDMLAIFAEFETNLRRERQLEGIAKAKAAGVYRGRPASEAAAFEHRCFGRLFGGDRPHRRSDPRRLADDTHPLVRADSGFAREELMAWCEANGVDYLFGLSRNERLVAKLEADLARVEEESLRSGKPARHFRDFMWTTLKSWSCRRRVVGKAEWTQGDANPRFVVTSLGRDECGARYL